MNPEQKDFLPREYSESPEKGVEKSLETRFTETESRLDISVSETFGEISRIEEESGASAQEILSARQESGLTEKIIANEQQAYELLAEARLKGFWQPLPQERKATPKKDDSVFMPEEELDAIRRASKEDRPELLRKFKEKLVVQQDGIAFVQYKAIRTIRENPNIDPEDLYEQVAKDGTVYAGMSPDQKQVAAELVALYGEKRAAVRGIREEYPEDNELYEAIFETKPKGKIEVIEGPITLYFRCDNPDDYALIFTQSFVNGREARKEEMEMAGRSGGVSIGSAPIINLQGCITAENTSRIKKGWLSTKKLEEYQEEIRAHEEQHALRRLFEKQLGDRMQWIRLRDSEPGESREHALRAYLRARRGMIADERAADEILAYSTQQTPTDTFTTLTRKKEKGGLYDYLAEEKEKVLSELLRMFGEEIRPLAEKEIQEIYENDYKNLLRDAIDMVKYFQGKGYTPDEVIALFIREPLSRWRKVAKRIYNERKSRLNTKQHPETKE